jgi:hypothetical protein
LLTLFAQAIRIAGCLDDQVGATFTPLRPT